MGTSSAQHVREFRLRNEAGTTVNVTGLQVSGDNPGDFVVTPPADTSLAPDEEGLFSVKFTPSADGQRFATLTVTTDSAAYPAVQYDLTGFGQATQSAPVPVADTLFAPADGFVEFTKLLTNDTDADTDPLVVLSAEEIPGTTRGHVHYDEETARVFYFAPDDGSTGNDSFTYTVGDRTTTITATATVQVIDPATVATGKTFRGSEHGDNATVTFGKLTPSAAAARKAVRSGQPRPRGSQASQSLIATISETVHGRNYSGKVKVDAEENDGDGALKGSQDNEEASITMSCDQDGNPIVKIYNPSAGGIESLGAGDTITLFPDLFDKKHPAPAEIVGTYTIALRGQDLDEQPDRGLGDSVASVTLSPAGKVMIKGVMADGAPFTSSAELTADNLAPFYIPLYKGNAKGSFSGTLFFVSGGSESGSLIGFGTWDKPLGITAFAEPTEFKARGFMYGGFYTPDELPSTLAYNFTFGADNPALATASGTLAKKFSLTGNLNGGGTFTLDSAFTLKTGLILGKRPKKATTGPLTFSGVVLQEQGVVVGSAVFDDAAEGDTFTASVTGSFPP
jgi:hypothetical protein